MFWFILISFFAVLLLSLWGASMRVEKGEGDNRESLITLDTGLRVAATLALLALIVLVFNTIREALGEGGFVTKLIPSVQNPSPNISWPAAFAISVPIVAMTVIVLASLRAIWHIVRQD